MFSHCCKLMHYCYLYREVNARCITHKIKHAWQWRKSLPLGVLILLINKIIIWYRIVTPGNGDTKRGSLLVLNTKMGGCVTGIWEVEILLGVQKIWGKRIKLESGWVPCVVRREQSTERILKKTRKFDFFGKNQEIWAEVRAKTINFSARIFALSPFQQGSRAGGSKLWLMVHIRLPLIFAQSES